MVDLVTSRAAAVVAAAPADAAVPTTRQRIVDAALLCFSRRGFHSTSMHEICAQAEMSPGALYRHFASKDAIIEAIAELERTRNREMLAHLDGEHDNMLEALLDTGFRYMRECAGKPMGALCGEVLVEAQRNARIRDIFERNNVEGRAALRSSLERAQARGEVDADIDIDVATTMLMALGDGLMLRGPFEAERPIDAMEPMLRHLVRRMLAPTGTRASTPADPITSNGPRS